MSKVFVQNLLQCFDENQHYFANNQKISTIPVSGNFMYTVSGGVSSQSNPVPDFKIGQDYSAGYPVH
jgi:hypothetical protein